MTDLSKLENIVLELGAHNTPSEGLCLLEAVAYVAGEPHSDRPDCVDPVLAAFGRALNDRWPHATRQRLAPLIPQLVGTRAGDSLSQRRAMLIVDVTVRQIVPMALDAIGRADHARALRAVDEVKDQVSARAAAAYATADAAAAAYATADAAAADADAADAAARAAARAARAAAYAAAAYATADAADAAYATADAAYAAADAADAAYATADAADAAARAAARAARAAAYAADAAREPLVTAVIRLFSDAIGVE